MAMAWRRRREPEEVPTPVAVAVADFCRRAGAPAPPAEVRQALATLESEEDFRARMVADGEPLARPLGPWALVDVVRGAAPDLAAAREACGYYALVRELVGHAPLPAAAQPPRKPAR